jgi:crotonobetainyl-CoA:carnitine CoA-transferase CaiB-like acyl-CoA transferase
MALPLAGIRVLAIEQFGAGPFSTLQLADLGAEVIKIEDPSSGGDIGRYVPPYQEADESLYFESLNRNKKSVSLDLRVPAGRAVFEDMVATADIVFSNLRGDQPKRLRITYDDLSELNPRIVCCSLSGFGNTGPRAAQGGYDYMMQGMAGWMAMTGEPDGPPTKSGLSLVDLSGGYLAAIAMVSAATVTSRCSRRRSPSSPMSGHGRRPKGGSHGACLSPRIRRSSPSRRSRQPTGGSSSRVPKRSSGASSAR